MTEAETETDEEQHVDGGGQELVRTASPGSTLAVTPQVKATELVERLDMIREAADTAMLEDVDYGTVPGTEKPTLLKPGAEKLGVLFQLDVQLANEKQWGPGDHLTVISRATVYHAPSGARLGYGEGICTTRERKYAYRKQQRTCPSCGAAAVIKGKEEYGGGWLCWKKRDGCGAKFADGDAAIESQEAGDIENPDLPDLWNTVVKMAEKRARVDAVLAVTGASALFTQDLEDQPREENGKPTGTTAKGNGETKVAQPKRRQSAPKANAEKPKDAGGDVASVPQRKMIFARFKEHGSGQENELRAILHWITGTSHTDRVPKAKVDDVLEAIKNAEQTLEEIRDTAADADRPDGAEAREIVDAYLREDGEQQTLEGEAEEK